MLAALAVAATDELPDHARGAAITNTVQIVEFPIARGRAVSAPMRWDHGLQMYRGETKVAKYWVRRTAPGRWKLTVILPGGETSDGVIRWELKEFVDPCVVKWRAEIPKSSPFWKAFGLRDGDDPRVFVNFGFDPPA